MAGLDLSSRRRHRVDRRHLVESSTTFEVPTQRFLPPLITAPTEELTEICTICHREVSVDCDVVLKCGHVFHMSCLGEYSKHCGHAPTRRSFQVPCANCRVVDRVELGTNPRAPQRYNPQEEAERPQLATRRRPPPAEPAPTPSSSAPPSGNSAAYCSASSTRTTSPRRWSSRGGIRRDATSARGPSCCQLVERW